MDPRATSQTDLSEALAPLLQQNGGVAKLLDRPPVTIVAEGDGMYSGDSDYYLKAGVSALQLVIQSLNSAALAPMQVRRVLDYACGYGRVTRWLQVLFPRAELFAADLDPKATAAVSSLFEVPTIQLKKDLSNPLPEGLDLVWIGSLFTHLADREVASVLRYLRSHLSDIGIVVATTHGAYVAERMRSREKTYNLSEERISEILIAFDKSGSAFAPYAGQADYGISVIRPSRMAALADEAELDLTSFCARAWLKHQDGYCLRQR